MEQQEHGSVCCADDYPWLVSQCLEEDGITDHHFYTTHDPLSHYRSQFPELLGKRIRGFNHGWVILSNNAMWSLWNPSTSKVIRFPPLNILKDIDSDDDDDIRQCWLSFPPDDPNSVLLLTRNKKPTFVFCRLHHQRKELRWTEMSYEKQLKKINGDGGLVHSLTCCNGKLYALNTGGSLVDVFIRVDIVVKDEEVVINLFLFGAPPFPVHNYYSETLDAFYCLQGSSTELFCICVGFKEVTKKTIADVTLFKLDTTNIKWEELEGLKDWDMTDSTEIDTPSMSLLEITNMMWEEMSDIKDAIFFVDLARDYSAFYRPATASDLGGYIHIRTEMGKLIHSYHFKDKTITLSCMPSPLLPTSHVPVQECRLEGDNADFKEEEDKDDKIVIRSVTDDQVESNDTHLLNLPFHVLEMIMQYCYGVEYLKFRATCKRCQLAAPLMRDKAALRRLQNYSLVSPWLMVLDKKQGIITFTDPLFGDKYFMKNVPVSIFDNRICCSRFGWLLLFQTNSELVLYNPFTSDVRKLPRLEYFVGSFCFSAPPTSPDCMVVALSRKDDWHVYIHFVARESSWRRLHLGFAGVNPYYFCSPTFFGTDLYALHEDKLHVFKDLGVDDYSWEQYVAEVPKSCCTSRAKHYLTKHDQHLLLVMVSHESIEVFKLDDYTKEWGKIDTLGRHMIYICETTSLCVEAKTPEMENKIYFPQLHSKNGSIVFYSLETCNYGTFNHKNIELTFTRMHHLCDPDAWIEPSWS